MLRKIIIFIKNNLLLNLKDLQRFYNCKLVFNYGILYCSSWPLPFQKNFQEPASPVMEGIIDFHHDLLFFLLVILGFVMWFLSQIGRTYLNSATKKKSSNNISLNSHNSILEIIWTLLPGLILLSIVLPSFALIYSMDEFFLHPRMTIKAIGNQWYWTYNYGCSAYARNLPSSSESELFSADYCIEEYLMDSAALCALEEYFMLDRIPLYLNQDFDAIACISWYVEPLFDFHLDACIEAILALDAVESYLSFGGREYLPATFILDASQCSALYWEAYEEQFSFFVSVIESESELASEPNYELFFESLVSFALYLNGAFTFEEYILLDLMTDQDYTPVVAEIPIITIDWETFGEEFLGDFFHASFDYLIEKSAEHFIVASAFDDILQLMEEAAVVSDIFECSEYYRQHLELFKEASDTLIMLDQYKDQLEEFVCFAFDSLFHYIKLSAFDRLDNVDPTLSIDGQIYHAKFKFDSYMIPEELLPDNGLRLLEVDKRLLLPSKTGIRLLVSSYDVLHSWAVPALGIKLDGCPGRLNQTFLFIKYEGLYYGQCSEICGVNHGFMPIVLRVMPLLDFEKWLTVQLCKNEAFASTGGTAKLV